MSWRVWMWVWVWVSMSVSECECECKSVRYVERIAEVVEEVNEGPSLWGHILTSRVWLFLESTYVFCRCVFLPLLGCVDKFECTRVFKFYVECEGSRQIVLSCSKVGCWSRFLITNRCWLVLIWALVKFQWLLSHCLLFE